MNTESWKKALESQAMPISRVPMIWWGGANFKAGHKIDSVVALVDIPNTLCRQADVDLMETVDGQDISHLLSGEDIPFNKLGVTEFAWSKSVRFENFRYIHYQPDMFLQDYPHGFGELYDLESDPWEMKNLYFGQDYQKVVLGLQKKLFNWLIRTSRPATSFFANTHNKKCLVNSQRHEVHNAVVNDDNKFNPEILRYMRGSNYL